MAGLATWQSPIEATIEVPVSERMPLVLGVDVGGTSTRAAFLSADGVLLGLARGGGANINSSPGDLPRQLGGVIAAAQARAREHLTAGTTTEVVAGVAGVAGSGAAAGDRITELLRGALGHAGIATQAEIVPDPVIAFAAGSAQPEGSVLLAGTGAASFRIEGFAEAARADALGWLLGDVGGGIWIALEGLRAGAASLDGRAHPSALGPAAAGFAAGQLGESTGDPLQDLIRVVHGTRPAELGSFARTVARLAAATETSGPDAAAAEIMERAAQGLMTSLAAVSPRPASTVVLAGSVLTKEGPVREAVRAQLSTQGLTTLDAAEPVVGAVCLAAHRAGWLHPDPQALGVAVGAMDTPMAAGPGSSPPASPRRESEAAPALTTDRYRPEDREQLYEICLRTGDSGSDATGRYRDGELLGHVYLGAYLALEPEHARVLRDADGKAQGYCVGTADTARFEERCEAEWWPALRERYPRPRPEDDSPDAALIRKIHEPAGTATEVLEDFPAHLHIDLLPVAQGGGNGKRLLHAVLDGLHAAGAPGVHLGVGGRNARAIGFYEHVGLRTVVHHPWGLTMGAALPLR